MDKQERRKKREARRQDNLNKAVLIVFDMAEYGAKKLNLAPISEIDFDLNRSEKPFKAILKDGTCMVLGIEDFARLSDSTMAGYLAELVLLLGRVDVEELSKAVSDRSKEHFSK